MTTAPAPPELNPAITRAEAVAMVVGSMIGAGVFIVSADVMRQVRYPGLALLAWAFAGLVLVAGGLTYAELGGMFPRAGGLYVYLREGISPVVGFLYGWTLFTVIWTGGAAAAAVGFARYASVLFPSLSAELIVGFPIGLPSGTIEAGISPQRILAVLSIVLITWINVRGVKTAAVMQAVFTVIKVGAVLALVALGLTIGQNPEAITRNFGAGFLPTHLDGTLMAAFAAALVGPFFAMDGWYALCFAASELKNPRRDLPFALSRATLIGAVLFLLLNVAYFAVLPAEAVAGAPEDRVAAAAMEGIMGPIGGKLMAAAIMISSFGLNIGIVLGGGRLFYAMANDGVLFKALGRLHPVYRTPATALVVQGVWIGVLCLSGGYGQLIDFVIAASLLFYLLIPVALIVLRRTRPDADRPSRVPGYPLVPLFYTAASGWVCLQLVIQRPQYSWPGLGIVLLGLPVYYLIRRRAAA